MSPLVSEPHTAVIGAGNLGGCLLNGWLAAGVDAGRLRAVDLRQDLLAPLAARGVATSTDLSLAAGADVVVAAIKPQVAAAVLPSLAAHLGAEQVLVSVIAGLTTTAIESHLPPSQPVLRVMPQTLVRLGAGATAVCAGHHASESMVTMVRALFAKVGTTVEVSEAQMDAVTGLSGSGPAYVYTVIEALIDGGVRVGLPRDVARLLAAQTVAGAARMVLEGEEHPGTLRDQVTSPGGTTIAGLAALEEAGLRHALIAAVVAATARAQELGRPERSA